MDIQLLNAIIASMGIIILSEALILIAGMNILKIGDWAWINLKNNIILLFDVLGGILMILLALLNDDNALFVFLTILLIFQFGTHIYRTFEYFNLNERRFCNNIALAVFNFVKTIGLIVILILLSI